MKIRILFIIAIVVIVAVSIGASFLIFAKDSPSQTTVVSSCNTVVTVNGTNYCSLDVTGSTTFYVPGYAIMHTPVRFMGVLFQTVCADDQSNCGKRTLTIYTPFILVNAVFEDGKNETLGTPLEIHTTLYFLSTHVHPRAGFYVEYVPGASVVNLKLFLLVEAAQ